jgi:hypothetical protein
MTTTQTTVPSTVLVIRKCMTSVVHRQLASKEEVLNMLLDIRSAAVEEQLTKVVERIDTTSVAWPKSELVSSSEVVDYMLDLDLFIS